MLNQEQLEIGTSLQRQYPNNMDLGKEFRSRFAESDLARRYPNNMDLGAAVRREIFEKIYR
jgi:hypothetical protein